MESIIKSKFDIEDILTAKKLLWELCSEQLGRYPNRRSGNREAKDAHLDDIIIAVGKLDAQNKLPVFSSS